MTPSQGTSPWLTKSPPNLTMPTIMCLCLAFLSANSSSGRSAGMSGDLRTVVRKMCWHFSQMQDLPSSSGRCLCTCSRSFSQRSVYISVYWCCLLEAWKMRPSKSSSVVLKSTALASPSAALQGSVSSNCTHSLSNFSGVNLLIIDRHCVRAEFDLRTLRALLDASFLGSISSVFCLPRDRASPAVFGRQAEPSSVEFSRPFLQSPVDFGLH
mmetsp:Transcript_71496/g.198441  ORF Transcript_71496/g.198441 Transcript_71496/m.198441 type:complete len:212 (-) Transcript_71496:331-966(-)